MKQLFLIFICMIAFTVSAETLNLDVKGMTCGGCESKFKSAAKDVKGIEEVNSVSASSGKAVITYDEKATTPEEAIKALAEKSGFTVSASTANGAVSAEGKPAGCCAKGEKNPACKKGGKAK